MTEKPKKPRAKPRTAKERDEEKRKELNTQKNLSFKFAIRKLLAANNCEKMESIAKTLISEAELGNVNAIKLLLERIDGIQKQELELSNSETNPISFIIASSQELISKLRNADIPAQD